MNGQSKLLKQLKFVCAIFFIIVICGMTQVHATDPSVGDDTTGDTVVQQGLPQILLDVKSVKVGDTKQITVDCWGSNFTKLQGLDMVLTYDSTKLTPSYLTGENQNEELTGLDEIKYDQRPELEEELEAFKAASKSLLQNSFAFESTYENVLKIDMFRYLAKEDNIEALQFVMSKNLEAGEISATDAVLLGTFSFKLAEGAKLEQTEFGVKSIGIICNDGLVVDDLSVYMREGDCSEIVTIQYPKTGSISGEIETGYYTQSGAYKACGNKFFPSKKTATIYLYKAEDVAEINWNASRILYPIARRKLINFMSGDLRNCYIPDENAEPTIKYAKKIKIEDGDNGLFTIDDIEYGEYVVFVDKFNYGDYIVTNIIVDADNQDINLGKLILISGDLNKNGTFEQMGEATVWNALLDLKDWIDAGIYDLNSLGLSVFLDLNDNGKYDVVAEQTVLSHAINAIEGQTIKKVVDFADINS